MTKGKGNPRKGEAGPGRPKGMPNKFTTLKADFLKAYEDMGGVDELATWGKANKAAFYRMLSTMLPKNVTINPSDYANDLMNKLEKEHPELAEVLGKVIADMES